jgi:large subunit ribosomal protein L7/L12
MKGKDILEAIKKLTAVELAELVNELKAEFGIDDSMLTVGSGGGAAAVAEDSGSAASTSFKVVINNVTADKKTELIKTIKTLLDIGLGEAKTMVDKAAAGEEVVVKTPLPKADADDLCNKLSAAGATAVVASN